jgi:Zn-dependent protease with chaperone function
MPNLMRVALCAVVARSLHGGCVVRPVASPQPCSIARTMEFEADMYGLNAARQPDGEANVDLLLGAYRKMEPGPIEEFLFFDHPSGLTRITAAMPWKAEHPETASPDEMARPMFDGKH